VHKLKPLSETPLKPDFWPSSAVHSLITGVVKPFPFNKVKVSQPLAMAIKPAVEDLIDFPLIGVIQLDQWWWVYCSVGDLTRASGLQQ